MAKQLPSHCHACQRVEAVEGAGARCTVHDRYGCERRDLFRLRDGHRGPIGPVPRRSFAYVAVSVPVFNDDGRRVA